MENQSYYMYPIGTGQRRNLTVPLFVNSTGYVKTEQPYMTSQQRSDWFLQLMDVGQMRSDKADVLKAGQFIIRSPDRMYRYGLGEEVVRGFYWVHFTGHYVETLLAQHQIESDRIYTLREETLQGLHQEFQRIFREFMLRRSGYEQMAAALLLVILVRLGRGIATDLSADTDMRKRLETSVSYIHSHYTEQLSVPELAKMEHLSESRYRELFRLAFGTPPGDYIIGLRMARACELLQSTDLSVAQIGEICGYSDVLYFSRLFHKKQKVAPLAYRRSDG